MLRQFRQMEVQWFFTEKKSGREEEVFLCRKFASISSFCFTAKPECADANKDIQLLNPG
jgi:hypothetical protein